MSAALKLPSSHEARRGLAVGILIVVAIVVVAAVGGPVFWLHRHYDAAIDRMTRQWQSQSAFNAKRQQMAGALEALKAREPRKLYLKGATAALAAAELQDAVKQTIELQGGRMISANPVPVKEDSGYRVITAQVLLNVSNTNLRRVLHALESQQPYVFLDNVTIRSNTPPGYRPPPGSQEPDLFVQFDASALAMPASENGVPQAALGGVQVVDKGDKT